MKFLIKSLRDLFSSENEFLALARTGKRITHIALAIPLVVIFLIGAMIISEGIIKEIILRTVGLGKVLNQFYGLFVSFGTLIFVVWLWVRLFEKRKIFTLGFIRTGMLRFYLKGFLTGLIMLSIVILLMALAGVVIFYKPGPVSINMLGIILLMLLGYMVQGAAEEVLTRGWQFQVIGARYKPWLGALISSTIFMLLHGFNTGISPLALFNLLLFAFLLTFYILYDKNIWAACGWHTAWNWTMENIYGLQVSGSEGFGSVLNLSADGPNYLTGGDFGPEGSIFTTIVLISGMILVLYQNSKKGNKR